MRELMRILKSTYRPLYQVLVELLLRPEALVDLLHEFLYTSLVPNELIHF